MLYSSRLASDFTVTTMLCWRTAKTLSAFRSRRDGTPAPDPTAHRARCADMARLDSRCGWGILCRCSALRYGRTTSLGRTSVRVAASGPNSRVRREAIPYAPRLMPSWSAPNRRYPPPKPGEPALHRAARLGDQSAIRSLVAGGASIDELFDIGLDPGARAQPASPLMVAAGSGEGATAETLTLLLELGAAIEPEPGLSPLTYACRGLGWNYPPGGDADRVAVLLAAGADPNAAAMNGSSALACAARSGDPARVRLLLAAGADPMPTCVGEPGGYPWFAVFRDPLMMAAESGSAACVRMLLDAGADLHHYPEDHEGPLSAAGSHAVLEMLLDAGADPNEPQGHGHSVIDCVATNAAVPIIERVAMLHRLAVAGADLDGRDFGTPPLFGAGLSFDDDAVDVLLRAGADPFVEPTALVGVCFSASDHPDPRVERIIDLLTAAGLDMNASDDAGLRPLHAALAPNQYGPGYAESDGFNEAAILALIRVGATIDITDPILSYRPLHAAAAAGSQRVVSALLAAGADPTEQTGDGHTPLDIARRASATPCVRLLERARPRQ